MPSLGDFWLLLLLLQQRLLLLPEFFLLLSLLLLFGLFSMLRTFSAGHPGQKRRLFGRTRTDRAPYAVGASETVVEGRSFRIRIRIRIRVHVHH